MLEVVVGGQRYDRSCRFTLFGVYINNLESYLIKNNLLYEFQFGFRSLYSTDFCFDHIKSQSSKVL